MTIDIAKSDILFHATSFYSAWKILKDRQLIASTSMGTVSEKQNAKAPFYVSFGREIYNSSSSSIIRLGGVVLEIDAKKLGNRYKISSVNYWGDRFNNSESEDRLFTPSNIVPLPLNQVQRVHVWYTDKRPPNAYLFNLVVLCLREGIRLTPHKTKSLTDANLDDFLEYVKKQTITMPDRGSLAAKSISALTRLLKGANLEKDKPAASSLKRLRGWNTDSVLAGVMADIHSYKKTQAVADLIREMRVRRIRDVKSLIAYIVKKYEN